MASNQTPICENIKQSFDLTSKCFRDVPSPYRNNCEPLVWIYRGVLIDCYVDRLFIPIAATLVVIGTVLNLFSLYCFLKMNKRNSQNVYLSVLSLADTINLQVNFTIPLLRQIDAVNNFFDTSDIICGVNGFLTEFFLIFPTWIIVLLTFERLICVLCPLVCRAVYTQRRAKCSILLLASVVGCLCLYRFSDLKGIDQVSVFSINACEGDPAGRFPILRNVNLFIWAILPECLALVMNLFIVYNIKLATQKFEPCHSKARQTKYNQATKTVLLISVLFLIFHTPTGELTTHLSIG